LAWLNAPTETQDAAAVPDSPGSPPTIDQLFAAALTHHQAQRLEAAEALYRHILIAIPHQATVLHNLGLAMRQREASADAVRLLRRAAFLNPGHAEGHSNLGVALRDQDRHIEAAAALEQAVKLRPDLAEAHNNLGGVYKELGRYDEAIAAFRAALALRPGHPEIHCNLAAALLQQGHYDEGWREHEWRLHEDVVSWDRPRSFAQPLWNGEDLAGKTLLLHSEQALGDDLQFSRYATPLAARGARVILEVAPSLTTLLRTVPGVADVVAKGETLPDYDFHLSGMSAPHRLGTTLETVPAAMPYIHAEQTRIDFWARRLAPLAGFKVGLVWAGDPRPQNRLAYAIDRRRSMKLATLQPLLELPGVRFVSLQKGDAANQIASLDPALRPHHWMDEVEDFADSAALICGLDLVISVDTSVAHLAGALGKPVWILSRFNGCWRWLEGREDSPWYPSARLFHQPAAGDWESVVAHVTAALREAIVTFTDHRGKKSDG
jgi:Flp pilus assembly protein TadD